MQKKSILLGLALGMGFGLFSCGEHKEKFSVEGSVSNAKEQMLYLEEVGTGSVLSLDSIKLDKDGKFSFQHEGNRYPMFYRLRLGKSTIPFTADSLTHIKLEANGQAFFPNYKLIEADQYNYQIRDIALYRYEKDRKIDSLVKEYNSANLSLTEVQEAVEKEVQELKTNFLKHYIYVNPKSPSAYFALFQTKGQASYFSADLDSDYNAFAAVGTAYKDYFPDAPYTPFLEKLALRAVARHRLMAQQKKKIEEQVQKGIETIAFPEIELKDKNGKEQKLSSYVKQKPVLLSFTAYSAQWSPMLVASMRKVQQTRPDIQIYEVSLDSDNYFWQNAVRTLPWLSVNDPEGETLGKYNVQSLPTFFYIDGDKLTRLNNPEELIK